MSDTAHRAAANRSIRKALDDAHRAWLARQEQGENQRTSLIKLAHTSMELHLKALDRGLTFEDGKSPLAVANTALATVRRNDGDSR
jgi:hypothetical protein